MTDKYTNRRAVIGVLAVMLAVVAIAAGIYAFTNGGSGVKSDHTLRATVNNDCSGTPWFVGVTRGFFTDAGLNFVDVGQTVTEQRPTALALGQVDVLDADPLTLVNLLKSGVNVTAVAQSGISSSDGDKNKEYLHWDVRNESDLATFASIANSSRTIKIGVGALGGTSELQTNALLRKYHVPKDRVEYVVIPELNQQQALRENIIDVAVLQPAFYGCTETRLNARAIATSTDALGPAGGMTLLILRDSFIREHPDTVERFIKGYKASERWCNNNRPEAGNITARRLGLCEGGAISHYYSDSGSINDAQVQDWLDEMAAQGVIQPDEYKPSDLYTDRFKGAW